MGPFRFTRSRIAFAVLCASLVVRSHAAAPRPAAAAALRPIAARGLMEILQKRVSGQPVVAVGEWRSLTLGGVAVPPDTTGDLLDRLQVIAEAVTDSRVEILPFQVGNAYALAPAQMEVDTWAAPQDAFESMGEGVRMDVALAALTPEDIAKLGSADGARISELPALTQKALARALRPPLQMPDGSIRQESLDLSNARLKARLRLTGASIPVTNGTSFLRATPADEKKVQPLNTASQLRQLSPPTLQRVPNHFKPSDLEGKALTRPIDIQGVFRLEDVLREAGRLNGIRIRTARPFRDVAVFVGSRRLTTGEVLDGIRLGVTGAFRHIGSSYILGYDRQGLAAVQQRVLENTGSNEEASRLDHDADLSETWELLARDLPFDEDDPFSLTAEQQKRLFDLRGNPLFDDPQHNHAHPDDLTFKIRYGEMTPRQQKALQDAVGVTKIFTPSGWRVVAADDVQNSFLQNSAYVRLTLSLPGTGWMPIQQFGFGEIEGYRLAQHRSVRLQEQEWKKPTKNASVWTPKPKALPTPERGLMTAVLGPGSLGSLAKQMRRHGFNVLFYPALDGGYASFPSEAFPLAPALREKNGLAAAMAAMKAEDIRVVPYVSVLAWQRPPQSAPHWMAKHPDWLERDVLGRTRFDLLAERPNWTGYGAQRALEEQGFVRANEPKVVAKLDTFMAELLAQPGVTGICLMDWNPNEPTFPGGGAPRFGFATADRLSVLAATGDDPVDLPLDPQRPRNPFWPQILDYLGASPESLSTDALSGKESPQMALARRLLETAARHEPPLKTYLMGAHEFPTAGGAAVPAVRPKSGVSLAQGPHLPPNLPAGIILPQQPRQQVPDAAPARPLADVMLSPARYLDPNITAGLLLPVWRTDRVSNTPPKDERDYPAAVRLSFRPGGPEFPATFASPIAVFDFRAAPDELSPSLDWFLPEPRADARLAEQAVSGSFR